MPYVELSPEKKLGGNFVRISGGRRMAGDFVPLNTRVPYSSLPRLGSMRGSFVNEVFSRPPYRNDMGRMRRIRGMGEDPIVIGDPVEMINGDPLVMTTSLPPETAAAGPLDGAMQWVKDNPLIAGGIALAAVLMLSGGRR